MWTAQNEAVHAVHLSKEAEMILEREVERALIRAVRKAGGMCLKFVSPGWAGAPDRLCLLPGGRMFFAEVKRPGGKPRPLQQKRHDELRKLGYEVKVTDSKEECDGFTRLSEVCG